MAPRFESDPAGLRAGVCLLEACYVLASGERPRRGSPTDTGNVRMYAGTMSRYLQENLAVSIAWFRRNVELWNNQKAKTPKICLGIQSLVQIKLHRPGINSHMVLVVFVAIAYSWLRLFLSVDAEENPL